MRLKFRMWWDWAIHRPTVLVNIIGILIIVVGLSAYLIYQAVRPLDVLSDWSIKTSGALQTRKVEGKIVSVYNPGDSLVFTSKSTKITEAKGTTTRTIVCEATATQAEREIQLDTLPASRPTGVSPVRENAITVPDVSQFAGLPRWCKLVIDITYENVGNTGRNHSEHAETERFLVDNPSLDPAVIRNEIKKLEERINQLESQLPLTNGTPEPITATPQNVAPRNQITNNTTTNNTTTNNNIPTPPPADEGFKLEDIPLVGGLLQIVGL